MRLWIAHPDVDGSQVSGDEVFGGEDKLVRPEASEQEHPLKVPRWQGLQMFKKFIICDCVGVSLSLSLSL